MEDTGREIINKINNNNYKTSITIRNVQMEKVWKEVKKRKMASLTTSNVATTHLQVKEKIEENNNRTSTTGGAIRSTELSKRWKEINWQDVFEGKITCNRLFVRSAIIRKDLLPQYACIHQLPSTCVQSIDEIVKFISEISSLDDGNNNNNENTTTKNNNYYCGYVLKPTDSSNAFGVLFFNDPMNDKRVLEAIEGHGRMILQPYPRPFLYQNKYKFHLRMMMLLVGDLDVYVHKKPRMLIATKEWNYEDRNWDNHFIHITNQSINVKCNEYDLSKQNIKFHGPQSGFSLEFKNMIFTQMKDIIKKLFKDLGNKDNNVKKSEFLPLRTSYELYGVDFLVNLKHEVILLEINPEPSMKVFNMKEQDQMVGADPFQRVPSTFVKVYSKEMLNALNMLRGR